MRKGIRVKLNPFFIIFLLVLPLAGMIVETALILLLVALHEASHALVARSAGIPVKEVELYPFGGVARTEGLLEIEPAVEKRIAWAGPLMNLLLALLSASFYLHQLYWGFWDESAVLFFIRANLIMAAFNLFPALPLDGGRILRAQLCRRYNYRAATGIAVALGKLLAAALFMAGLFSLWHGYANFSFLAAGVFVFLAASREKELAVYSFLRSLGTKDREIINKKGIRGEQIVVSEEATLLDILRLFTPRRYHLVRVMEPRTRRLKQELTETVIVEQALKKGVQVPVKKIIK